MKGTGQFPSLVTLHIILHIPHYNAGKLYQIDDENMDAIRHKGTSTKIPSNIPYTGWSRSLEYQPYLLCDLEF